MPAASYQDRSQRRRLTSLALTIAAHVLIVLLLLRLGPGEFVPRSKESALSTFTVADAPAGKATPAPRQRREVVRVASASPPPRPHPPVTPPPPTPAPALPSNFINLSEQDLASTDQSMRTRGEAAGAEGDAAGRDSVAAYGPGEGPGGQRLYNAQWYREPSQAELDGYMPPVRQAGSWGMIACQTIEQYRVDNCRTLGESPLGSGIARAMRQAAWQFRVLPPRLGGKKMIGAWVRIRIDFTERGASVRG